MVCLSKARFCYRFGCLLFQFRNAKNNSRGTFHFGNVFTEIYFFGFKSKLKLVLIMKPLLF